jgi:hypothetical protein
MLGLVNIKNEEIFRWLDLDNYIKIIKKNIRF